METERVRATNYAGRTAVITRATLQDIEKEYMIIRNLIMHNDFITENQRQRLIGLYTFKTIEEIETPEWYKKKMEQEALAAQPKPSSEPPPEHHERDE